MKKFLSRFVIVATLCIATLLSTPALANTFAGGIPQAVPYTYNGTTYDRYIVISRTAYNICSNTLALYFVSSEMTSAGYPNGTNYYAFGRAYPGNVPGFTSQPTGSHMLIFEAYNNSGVCSWHSTPDAETTNHQGTYTLRSDVGEAIHDHNFDLYTYNTPWGTLPYTFTSTYSAWGSWAGNGLKYGGQGFLSFPLSGVTPYNTSVSSVMDQDTLGTATAYATNNSVTAFNGQVGSTAEYSTTDCWSNSFSTNFLTGVIDYDGYTGGASYLCYDGHPGFDYPKAEDTPILATAGGYLCVATSFTSPATPPATRLWRNTTYCPQATGPAGDDWTGYHTIYIMHGPLYINGSTNDYMTVYLHSNDLEATVRSAIETNGYATINKLQEIALVGDVSPSPVGFHVHMETYKKVSGVWQRVDPYGDGTNNILWEH